MKEIQIQIERSDLKELGIDQEASYIPLRFKESAFYGYFCGEELITVYIGSESFLCLKAKKNIELFDSLL
jgi:hypothetical protein